MSTKSGASSSASRSLMRRTVTAVTLALVVAMPAAMLPVVLGGTSAPAAATTVDPSVAPFRNASTTLPTVPGALPHTGEGAITRTPAPSLDQAGGSSGSTDTGSAAASSSSAAGTGSGAAAFGHGAMPLVVVGSPPNMLMPGMFNMPNTTQPNSVDHPTSVYDSTNNQVVDFGGCTSGPSASCSTWSNQTYTFDGTHWTLKSPATSPSARTDQAMAFDPRSEEHTSEL